MVSTSIKNIYSVINLKKNVPFHYKQVLSCKALKFIADIHLNFNSRRLELQSTVMMDTLGVSGSVSNTLPLKYLRNGELAYEFVDRKIEIVKPSTLNSEQCYSSSEAISIINLEQEPLQSWENIIECQIKLKDAINQSFLLDPVESSDSEILVEQIVPFIIQPRRLNSNEENILINKEPVSAAVFDFGLFFFHNAKKLIVQGHAPYFYFANIENHYVVKFWNDILNFAEEQLSLPRNITQAVV